MSKHPFTDEEVLDYLPYDAPDGYDIILDSDITYQSRWSTYFKSIFHDKATNCYWQITWSRGSTEQQDNGVEDLEIEEVVPVQVITTTYEKLKKKEKEKC